MATGVPRKKVSAACRGEGQPPPIAVALSYQGKTPAEDILRLPRAEVSEIWEGEARKADNRLIFGDNLDALLHLLDDQSVRGKVKLVYIDPPFATQTVFHSRNLSHAYEDVLAGAAFIESLRKRLIILRELLASDGSIYLHLDEKMIFHMKIVMDEVFGAKNYLNCIVRKKCNPKNYTRKKYGNISDYILFYSKTDEYVWNKPLETWTEERAKEYQYVEEGTGRRFMKVPIHAPGVRNGATGTMWRGMMPPPGKHWQFTPDKLDELDARGEIFWSANGNPRRKVYLDENKGVGVQDIWLDFKDAHNQNICITGYPTEKNPALLERIIDASSGPGDLVLDAYSGSGTTVAVAAARGRRWIGIDASAEAINTTLRRFSHGLERMGDFVGARNGRNRERLQQQELKLHGTNGTHNGYSPGTDFSLLATKDHLDEAKKILQSWQRSKQKTK